MYMGITQKAYYANMARLYSQSSWFSKCKTVKVKITQSFPTNSLWPHGLYTVQGTLQARKLKWIAIPFTRASSQPRNLTQVSPLQADSFPTELCGKRRKMLHGAIAIICQSDALKVKNSLENPISSCQVGSCSKLCLLNHLGNWQNFSLLPKVFSIM